MGKSFSVIRPGVVLAGVLLLRPSETDFCFCSYLPRVLRVLAGSLMSRGFGEGAREGALHVHLPWNEHPL